MLLLLYQPSFAGQWVITYSNKGSTSFDTIRPPSSLVNYTTNNSPTSNSASVTSGSGKVDFAANASIVATLTWQPASGQTLTTDPPPTSPVSILETGTATEGPGPWNGSGPAPYPQGTASDGLGDPQTVSGDGHGYFSSGAHLIQKDGSSGTITLDTVTLSATCPHTTFVNGSPDWEGSSGVNVRLSVQVFQATLQGHSTVDTSAPGNPWNPTNPRFFSGTNCSAIANAAALSGYVFHAELLVGGTDVKDYYDTSFNGTLPQGAATGTNQTSASLSVYFDSTHFADAGSVPIQLIVTDTNGNAYTGQISANAYNKAYSLGNYQPSGGSLQYGQVAATNASSVFQGMNCSGSPTTTDGKTKILANLPTYTVFYIWTHGVDLPSEFGDCFASPTSTDANYLFANASDDSTEAMSVTQAVAAKTVSVPPYNFAFCDACLTAQNDLMAGAFGVTTSSTDLAYLGYTTDSDDSQYNANWTNYYLKDLSSGLSTGAAQADTDNTFGYPLYNGEYASTYVWGDKAAKVHGVYGGSGTQWFK